MSEKITEPYVCTAVDPGTPEKSKLAIHPDAKYLSATDYGGGEYCEKYECPNCGKRFEVELPQ